MKQMTSDEIRRAFLDFFAERGHKIVSSSSLVPGNDPTLLFTNAGMVQFKDIFLGHENRDYVRATTSQKCMRISGKHNDLENVGPSPRHHTFFEMLGNFSFGDYFKRDAIRFAYELLTEVYGLPPDRLTYTVYKDDDEAYDIWVNDIGVDPARVARMGPKTNFWQMAETGPCGPTSEVHWDLMPELGEDSILAALEVEDDRFLELWNLVFMQFNRTEADPNHTGKFDDPLPAPGVDTGLGLERLAAVLQSAEANYDTDLFTDIMDATQEVLGHSDEFRDENFVAYRVIADHIRAASFLIADGVNPGATGRDYIPRMLIRRAWRFAHGMDVDRPFLADVADALIAKMSAIYPELEQSRSAIRYQIGTQEQQFIRTLDSSLDILDQLIEVMKSDDKTVLDGRDAFDLYSSRGLPLEITRDILQEHGLTIDEPGFDEAMEAHRVVNSDDPDIIVDLTHYAKLLESLKEHGSLEADGVGYDPYNYERLNSPTRIVSILRDGKQVEQAVGGEDVEVILAETPFYVESGGQVSDTGAITGDDWNVEIVDVREPVRGLILHVGKVERGTVRAGASAMAIVDEDRRWDIMRHHTATHLLHASLRNVLGEHVQQKGSLVAPDRLRFDFSHNERVTQKEIDAIEEEVNRYILNGRPVDIGFKDLDEARREGAMALFGEKYDATVRTVTIPDAQDVASRFSYELCGGTHVRNTAEIGPFLITRESSPGSGMRRIEALSGRIALDTQRRLIGVLNEAAANLGSSPDDVPQRIAALQEELSSARREIEAGQRDTAKDSLDSLIANAQDVNGTMVVAARVAVSDPELIGEMADWIRDRLGSGVVVLVAEADDVVRLVAAATPDVVERGIHAGKLVGAVAKLTGGGGGGRPNFATAGGKDPAKIDDALGAVEGLVTEALS